MNVTRTSLFMVFAVVLILLFSYGVTPYRSPSEHFNSPEAIQISNNSTPLVTGHWYSGMVYNGPTQYVNQLSFEVQIPSGSPNPTSFYYAALLSVFDSASSYDQIGVSADGGNWELTWSWTYLSSNGTLNYVYNPSALYLIPGQTYNFYMFISGGWLTYGAYDPNLGLYYNSANYTGGYYFILSTEYNIGSITYVDYTNYEEVYTTQSLAPSFNFLMFNNYAANFEVTNWEIFSANSPSQIKDLIISSNLLVENIPYSPTYISYSTGSQSFGMDMLTSNVFSNNSLLDELTFNLYYNGVRIQSDQQIIVDMVNQYTFNQFLLTSPISIGKYDLSIYSLSLSKIISYTNWTVPAFTVSDQVTPSNETVNIGQTLSINYILTLNANWSSYQDKVSFILSGPSIYYDISQTVVMQQMSNYSSWNFYFPLSFGNSGPVNLKIYVNDSALNSFAYKGYISLTVNDQFSAQFATIETSIGSISTDLSNEIHQVQYNLTANITALNSKIATLNGQLIVQSSEISAVQAYLNNVNATLKNLERNISLINSQISTMENDISQLEFNISNLHGNVSNLEAKVSTLEDNVSNLQKSSLSLENETATLQQKYTSEQISLNNVSNKQSGLILPLTIVGDISLVIAIVALILSLRKKR